MASAATKQNTISFERIQYASQVIAQQTEAVDRLGKQLPAEFDLAIELMLGCRGSVIVTGMGKAGWIGQKVCASLASTGTRSHFLHPAEAIHGDLGRIGPEDLVLAFSNSGETSEVVTLLPSIKKFSVPLIAVTANRNSTLSKQADLVLDYGKTCESGHLGLAPSTTTTLMLVLGDAIALTLSHERKFQPQDFARFHPGGSLGRRLSLVEEIMRPIEQCRVAVEDETVRSIYIRSKSESRRSGAVMVVARESGKLAGVFTDSDLARLLEREQDSQFDQSIAEVMTHGPVTVTRGTRLEVAIETLACRNISELPVVDSGGVPIGLIDITDVVSL
ncbi:KpsF/GutQ family sugar-phosphate isomerase [Mariniblastus fucicola]|uniref:Arabinose 5-phosphate isomerase KpsF n=1 Tax=Mariniblastus fucicola TaxID=980251 RepID=A0A5B9PFU1_9BACT|nr:KpsF/GutQ family sugar-phosphate isomerase [Mariniblastus fucicola]QEG23506.1 Arabinose 5-phosphate isomerase KpsF [Mariniblastus fucicola]